MGEDLDPPLTPVRESFYDSDEQASLYSRRLSQLDRTLTLGSTYTSTPSPRRDLPTRVTSRRDGYPSAVQLAQPMDSGRVTNNTATSSKPIYRKPVESRRVSESSSTPRRELPRRSATESGHLTTMLAPPQPSTNMLFNQASRSLTSLTQDANAVPTQVDVESPPPYTEPSINPIPRGDVKPQNTPSQLETNGAPLDAILLIRENRLDILQTALDQGLVLNDIDPNTRRTAIMEVADLRRLGAARILLRSGCRLHLKDVNGWTALHFASFHGDVEMCRLLLDAGALLDEYSNNGDTPLFLAALAGHSDVVMCLLNSWASQMSSGLSLLNGFLAASKSGSVRTAELFIERGINPKKIKDPWRPVCFAAQSGSIPMIDFMIAQKCNIKQRDRDGKNALHFAAEYGHTAMVEKLLALNLNPRTQTNKSQETPLHLATLAYHNSTAMPLILHKNASNDMKDADGVPALHHCARNGDMALTTTLLNQGAKLDEASKYGWTPMLLVCAYGHIPLVMEFITRGVSLEEKLASPSFKPREKTNEAARKGYWAELRWPHQGARPLHLALEFSRDEVANTLIAAGAKIEEADSEGWKPLHYAAFNARPYMVELLLNKGASPHATTDTGNTPLSLGFREPGLTATYEEKLQVCELLQAAMNAHKKSKVRRLSDFMTGHLNKSKEVAERNKIWHTAQLAETLYQSRPLEDEDEEDEVGSLVKSTSSHQHTVDDDENVLDSGGGGRERNGPSRITKSMTD